MNKLKLIITMALSFVVLFAQVGNVAAAPQAQTPTPITGTIVSVTPETDTNGVTTVVVELVDSLGATQTVRISLDTAVSLGLVTVDPITNAVTVVAQPGQAVEIDPTAVIPDPVTGPVHPISALLAAFFGEDASVIDSFHTNGFGFGVIAQALWMSENLNGDASLTSLILEAKQSGDYSAFTLPDGTIATNWGQFKKALSNKKNNLGVVVSGHAENPSGLSTQPSHGNGNGNGHGNGNGKGNGNGHGNGNNKP